MATTTAVLYRGAAATSSTTLYTVPSSTTAIVTEIMVANTTGSTGNFTITLNGTAIASTVSVGAYDTTVIQCKQVVATTQIIAGSASTTGINLSICGVTIA